MDPSHGYDRWAVQFLAARGHTQPAIGAETVRTWARTLPRGAAVLDLGCGSGFPISQVLIEEGLGVYGVDASPILAAAFHERFPDLPIACEPAETSAFFNRTFDAIVAWGLVFLLPGATQRGLIRRMAGALTPGGRLLFTSPAQRCTWSDVLTGAPSLSLGAAAYTTSLRAAGLSLVAEYDDEGQNHYYDAVRHKRARARGP